MALDFEDGKSSAYANHAALCATWPCWSEPYSEREITISLIYRLFVKVLAAVCVLYS